MKESKRSHHKQRKWTCPTCSKVRMEKQGAKREVGGRMGIKIRF